MLSWDPSDWQISDIEPGTACEDWLMWQNTWAGSRTNSHDARDPDLGKIEIKSVDIESERGLITVWEDQFEGADVLAVVGRIDDWVFFWGTVDMQYFRDSSVWRREKHNREDMRQEFCYRVEWTDLVELDEFDIRVPDIDDTERNYRRSDWYVE